MKPKKKNSAFTFICSFLPGAAEMYLGFMKMGFSLLGLFFISFMIPALLGLRDICIFIPMGIWFFGFFHARNLAACDEQEFSELEDRMIWNDFMNGIPVQCSGKTAGRWTGWALILIGFVILWSSIKELIYDAIPDALWERIGPMVSSVPGMVFSIAVILIGIKMIAGKKAQLSAEENGTEEAEDGEEY